MKFFTVLSAYGTARAFLKEMDAVREFNSHVVEENKIENIEGFAAGDGNYDEPGVVLTSDIVVDLKVYEVIQYDVMRGDSTDSPRSKIFGSLESAKKFFLEQRDEAIEDAKLMFGEDIVQDDFLMEDLDKGCASFNVYERENCNENRFEIILMTKKVED